MEYEVLKPFPFSADGVTVRTVAPGERISPSAGAASGLQSAGYIREVKALAGAPETKGGKRSAKPETDA